MDFGLNITGIVEQDIEHVVAFMVVSADDFCIHRDVIGHQGEETTPFLRPKYLGEYRALMVLILSNF